MNPTLRLFPELPYSHFFGVKMVYEISHSANAALQNDEGVFCHNALWGGVAHRQADGCEYHPVKLPRRLAATPLQKFEVEFSHNAMWVATSAGDADATVRWDSCRLDFFVTFLVKQKSKRENGRAGGISMSLEFLVLFFQEKSTEEIFSYATNGDFWTGAATGFASSLMGTATSSFHPLIQIGASTITGGLTSKITGGTFWQGAVNGFLISALNHAVHGIDDALTSAEIKRFVDKMFPGRIPDGFDAKFLLWENGYGETFADFRQTIKGTIISK